MTKVSPMPGEMAGSHLLRIQIVNGVTSLPQAIKLLKASSANPHLPLVNHLADHCGIDRLQYAKQCSFLPISRLSAKAVNCAPHGSDEGVKFSQRRGMIVPVNHPRFCRECASSDFEMHGFSWYRREHHLVGVNTCIEHEEPLWQLSEDAKFDQLPHSILRANTNPIGSELMIDGESNQFVQRYKKLVKYFLSLGSPINSEKLHLALGNKAAEKLIRKSAKGARHCASDLIKKTAPLNWIAQHFPELKNKKEKQIFSPIDSLLFQRSTPGVGFNYALLAALLYEDIESVLTELPNDIENSELKMNNQNSRGQRFWHGEAYELYYKHEGDIELMAKLLEMDYGWLKEKLHELGMPNLKTDRRKSLYCALEDFCRGGSLTLSARNNDIDAAELESLLRCTARRIVAVIDRSKKSNFQ